MANSNFDALFDTTRMIPIKVYCEGKKIPRVEPTRNCLAEQYKLRVYSYGGIWRIFSGDQCESSNDLINCEDFAIWNTARSNSNLPELNGNYWNWTTAEEASRALCELAYQRWLLENPSERTEPHELRPGMVICDLYTRTYAILCSTNGIYSWNTLNSGNWLCLTSGTLIPYTLAFPGMSLDKIFVPPIDMITDYLSLVNLQ